MNELAANRLYVRIRLARRYVAFAAIVPIVLLITCCRGEPNDRAKRATLEGMYQQYRQSFPDTPELTVDELVAIREAPDVILVDVREPAERQVSRIPGSISKSQFEADRDTYRDKRIVTYCTVGYRSGLYARQLHIAGFKASNLKGSILAWVHAGHEVVDDEDVTSRVHVYGQEWNLLPSDFEPVWFTDEQRKTIERR